MIEIASDALTATINPLGAELSGLRDAAGNALMTDGDPAWWTGRAPLLFPIVGTLAGDTYRLDGKSYSLPRHGFARRQAFEIVVQEADRAVLRLTDNEATRAAYPFAFALDAEFALSGATLSMTITAANRGEADMPASFGFHPGFSWPLPYGAARGEHRILFEREEHANLRLLTDGLVAPVPRPSPVEGRTLQLRDGLFDEDALIWDVLASKSLVYGAEGFPGLAIEWDNCPMLGIWTKPGGPYVCIEPWAGIADPAGFSGEIWDKPGIVRIAPGASQRWTMRVALTGA